jgi:hypothetical protein
MKAEVGDIVLIHARYFKSENLPAPRLLSPEIILIWEPVHNIHYDRVSGSIVMKAEDVAKLRPAVK